MVKAIRLYIEGDAKQKGKNNAIALREGFHNFFSELIEKARAKKLHFHLIMGNSKYETFKDFLNGVNVHPDSAIFFLLDSDDELETGESVKSFLQRQNGNWHMREIEDDQCHVMVQVMESWFLADKEKLQEYYGQGFNLKALPKNKNVEKIAKTDVEIGLVKATKDSQKGDYHKTKHGPKILQSIDSKKVRQAAPHCDRLFKTISESLE